MALWTLFFFLSSGFLFISSDAVAYSSNIDFAPEYKLKWEVDDAKMHVTFTVEAKTTGWVGFGFDRDMNKSKTEGVMHEAEMLYCGAGEGDKHYIKDIHGNFNIPGKRKPIDEAEDNWIILSGTIADKMTTVVFRRDVKTKDTQNNPDFEDKNVWFLWAMAPDNTNTLGYHKTNRGSKKNNVLGPVKPDEQDNKDNKDNKKNGTESGSGSGSGSKHDHGDSKAPINSHDLPMTLGDILLLTLFANANTISISIRQHIY